MLGHGASVGIFSLLAVYRSNPWSTHCAPYASLVVVLMGDMRHEEWRSGQLEKWREMDYWSKVENRAGTLTVVLSILVVWGYRRIVDSRYSRSSQYFVEIGIGCIGYTSFSHSYWIS